MFGYLWAAILKNCCHILNQKPQVYQNTKFRNAKKINFETKNTSLWYLRVLILKNYRYI